MIAFDPDRPPIDLADQIDLAERWFCRALRLGDALSAQRWLRVVDLLSRRAARLAAAVAERAPAACARITSSTPLPSLADRESWESKKSPGLLERVRTAVARRETVPPAPRAPP